MVRTISVSYHVVDVSCSSQNHHGRPYAHYIRSFLRVLLIPRDVIRSVSLAGINRSPWQGKRDRFATQSVREAQIDRVDTPLLFERRDGDAGRWGRVQWPCGNDEVASAGEQAALHSGVVGLGRSFGSTWIATWGTCNQDGDGPAFKQRPVSGRSYDRTA